MGALAVRGKRKAKLPKYRGMPFIETNRSANNFIDICSYADASGSALECSKIISLRYLLFKYTKDSWSLVVNHLMRFLGYLEMQEFTLIIYIYVFYHTHTNRASQFWIMDLGKTS